MQFKLKYRGIMMLYLCTLQKRHLEYTNRKATHLTAIN